MTLISCHGSIVSSFFFAIVMIEPIAANPSEGTLTVEQFVQHESKTVLAMVGSAGEAFGWYNLELKARGEHPLYCAPEKLAITREQYMEILKRKVAEDKQKSADFRSWPLFLLNGLIDTFPCK